MADVPREFLPPNLQQAREDVAREKKTLEDTAREMAALIEAGKYLNPADADLLKRAGLLPSAVREAVQRQEHNAGRGSGRNPDDPLSLYRAEAAQDQLDEVWQATVRLGTAPPAPPPAPKVVTEVDFSAGPVDQAILRVLAENHRTRYWPKSLCTATRHCACVRTICNHLHLLEGAKLVCRPDGQNSGYEITNEGIAFIQAILGAG
jgi:hypothetical protein